MFKVKSYSIDLHEEIGRGAFGSVYKGRDASNKTVAAKRISVDEDAVSRKKAR